MYLHVYYSLYLFQFYAFLDYLYIFPDDLENLDLPGGYPDNSSGQSNSPDGGNTYCQSTNNNNNIPQVKKNSSKLKPTM